MLDSIHLRYHDNGSKDFAMLMAYLLDEKLTHRLDQRQVMGQLVIDKEAYKGFPQKIRNNYLALERIADKEKVMLHHKGKKFVPSSHYAVSWLERKDCLDFVFSIPKFLYGHNIAQFLPNVRSKTYSNYGLSQMAEMEVQKQILFSRLHDFIEKFFHDLTFGLSLQAVDIETGELYHEKFELNKEMVEIRRLDFCYNQYFDSKEDALQYLEYQKRFIKNYVRASSLYGQDKWTSVNYRTQTQNVKIYHKGSEYLKSDRKKHKNLNDLYDVLNKRAFKMMGGVAYQYFDINALQKEADKILRYEVAFDVKAFSYLYKWHYLSSLEGEKYKQYRAQKTHYSSIKNLIDNHIDKEMIERAKKIAQKGGTLSSRSFGEEQSEQINMSFEKALQMEETLEMRYREKKIVKKSGVFLMSEEDKTLYNTFHKFIQKRCRFFLGGSFPSMIQYEKRIGGIIVRHERDQLLTAGFFRHMADRFLTFVNHYQVKQLPTTEVWEKKVHEFNERAEENRRKYKKLYPGWTPEMKKRYPIQGMRITEMRRIFSELEKNTLDELVRLGKVEPRTARNWRKKLELLELDRSAQITDLHIQPKVNFMEYYHRQIFKSGHSSALFLKGEMLFYS